MSGPLDKRYFACSILEFLDREVNDANTTADRRESLKQAIRNLETAFNVKLTNQEFRRSPALDQIYQDYFGADPEVNRIIDTGDVYILPMETNDENKLKAETHKNAGNEGMTDGRFWDALESYSIAINLDGRNAAYFCNRAASYLKLNNLAKALRDCQVAIQLNPEYARAYGRMGLTYSAMADNARAYACYLKAAELEPEIDTYRNNALVTQEILALERANTGNAANTGPSILGAIAGLRTNPRIINMIQTGLENGQEQLNRVTQLFTTQNLANSFPPRLVNPDADMHQVVGDYVRSFGFGNQLNQDPPRGNDNPS